MSIESAIAELELSFEKVGVHADHQLVLQLGRLLLPNVKFPISEKNSKQIIRKAEERAFRDACHLVEQDPILSWRILCQGTNSWEMNRQAELDVQRIALQMLSSQPAQALSQFGPAGNIQDFFRGRGIAWQSYQMQLLACSLAEEIFREMIPDENGTTMRLAGILAFLQEIAAILIAYVRPHWTARCAIDASRAHDETFQRNLRKLFRKSLYMISSEMVALAEGPKFLADLIAACDVAPWNRRAWTVNNDRNFHEAASAAFVANRLIQKMSSVCSPLTFAQDLDLYNGKLRLPDGKLRGACSRAMSRHVLRCGCLGLPIPTIPRPLEKYFMELGEDGQPISTQGMSSPDQALPFLWELKACVRTTPSPRDMHRLPQAIYTTMLGLIHGLNFERACFSFVDERARTMKVYCVMGKNLPLALMAPRDMADEANLEFADMQAFYRATAVTRGTGLAEEDWPFIAFPAMCNGRVFGTFYAARQSKTLDGLTNREEMTCLALAEEWQQVSARFFEETILSPLEQAPAEEF